MHILRDVIGSFLEWCNSYTNVLAPIPTPTPNSSEAAGFLIRVVFRLSVLGCRRAGALPCRCTVPRAPLLLYRCASRCCHRATVPPLQALAKQLARCQVVVVQPEIDITSLDMEQLLASPTLYIRCLGMGYLLNRLRACAWPHPPRDLGRCEQARSTKATSCLTRCSRFCAVVMTDAAVTGTGAVHTARNQTCRADLAMCLIESSCARQPARATPCTAPCLNEGFV